MILARGFISMGVQEFLPASNLRKKQSRSADGAILCGLAEHCRKLLVQSEEAGRSNCVIREIYNPRQRKQLVSFLKKYGYTVECHGTSIQISW